MSNTPESAFIVAGIGCFFNILRFAVDIVTLASRNEEEKAKSDDNSSAVSSTAGGSVRSGNSFGRLASWRGDKAVKKKKKKEDEAKTSGSSTLLENTALVDETQGTADDEEDELVRTQGEILLSYISVLIHIVFFAYFLAMTVLNTKESIKTESISNAVYNGIPLGSVTISMFFGSFLAIYDFQRQRFGTFQRIAYFFSSCITMLGCIFLIALPRATATNDPTVVDYITLTCVIVYFLLAVVEAKVFSYPHVKKEAANKKAHLGKALFVILKPYFWPDATATSALLNRTRAILTWVCVGASKACSLASPIFLGRASTALAVFDYKGCARNAVLYGLIQFCSTFFKECQSLVYLRVAQAAFVQLSELSFHHLHSLSLDWHLKKKLGEVIRSMDRGIAACDILMKYLFLWMVPAIAESILVCVIFAAYFDYLPLALTIFVFVFVYMVWTIVLTLWRKKFRKAVTVSDNDWHDKCTDSLINFETVKYFTAEKFEIDRFTESVQSYQSSSVDVQASLSFLNITQMILMQTCLAVALVLSSFGIKKRFDCCMEQYDCELESGLLECCASVGSKCGGMEIGDFVAVLTYTLNLFGPLNFLGSVYNAVVMALIDLRNLSELLAEEPGLTDAPDAMELPRSNEENPEVAVEFDNVHFKYPAQVDGQGLTGVSFKMLKGTTTAIVGTTGAGKTTISRLLFRFYDVDGGAVKVNGRDVRTVTQQSLREAIGVVPQSTSMFNDTIKHNILYGKRDATDEELDKVAESAQMLKFIRALPEGWETMVGDRGLKLSGGEKQRTAIARCLLKDPPFVMLDEATSALDTVTENSVQEALDALGSERTCLVIAHRLGTIRNADNIVVLGDGVVLEQGSHDELLQTGGKYAEMWNMQLHSTQDSSSHSTNLSNDIIKENED